jgi:diguanylate cyclase (GGDEF)-like protein/PAS domain S-box-containing protein
MMRTLATYLIGSDSHSIKARLVGAFLGVASLTLVASIVAFLSYNYIAGNLHRIEVQGIPVMAQALVLARQTAEYSAIASTLRSSNDKTALAASVAELKVKQDAMDQTLNALQGKGIAAGALKDLKGSADELEASTADVATVIEQRLSASVEREKLVARALTAHRAIIERLAPLLDEAGFDLTMGLESLDRAGMRNRANDLQYAQRNASALQDLSDLRAESHILLGILMEVSQSSNSDLLTPLRDRFTASSDRAKKALAALEKTGGAPGLQPVFEALLAFGAGSDDLFRARRDELEIVAQSQQLAATSQWKAAMLAKQVQLSVKSAEQATSNAVGGATTAIRQSQISLIALASLSLGSAIILAWLYVGRGLLARLNKLNDAILALAAGNLDVDIPHGGHDELTRVAAAVEVFKRSAIEARELEADKERGRIADLKQREASFRLLFESNPVPMWVYDLETLKFLSVNDAALRHYGYSRARFQGMTVLDIRPADDRKFVAEFLRNSAGDHQGEEVWQHVKADGTPFHVVTYSRALPYQGVQAALVAIIDITERKRAEARIAHMAHHDALTNLANRVLFRQRLEEALNSERQSESGVTIFSLDLDRFKEVNDTLGHPIGDALLKAVTERLCSCIRETDTIARLGGDEFAIIQHAADQAPEAAKLAKRIQEAVCTPFDLSGHHVTVGTTIGIAIAPGDGTDPDQLLKNADLALYRAKSEGRGTYRFFEAEMNQRMQARRELERDLRNALADGGFDLHYQPLVNLERNEVCGFEALLRWDHADRGKVPPLEFIPLAEETGLIVPIGEWVLRRACTDAAKWPTHLKIAVNISAAQFRSRNLLELIVNVLATTGLAPNRLELEITESVTLEESEATFATLQKLHDFGVRIALDDFGTGYSSLSNLRKFPFDKIKIDRSFVSDLSHANVDAVAIVRSVAQLGVTLGMATTAEGVETGEQLEKVRAEGCTEMQGYFCSKPMAASEVQLFLAKQGRSDGRVLTKAASAA